MKLKQICAVVLLSLAIAPTVFAQSFDNLWKQVEQAEKKSLPRTVIQLTGDIYRKGEVEKNSPQMLKAYTWRMRYRDMLTPDSFYVSLQGLEQWAQTADKPMDRSVLHSLIAGIYADYAAQNRWQIRQRVDITGEAPSADIREWTGNQLVQQVKKHTLQALPDSELLLKTSARTYIPFVELADASEYYRHDMYHLLGSRGVDALKAVTGIGSDSIVREEIKNIYQSMMSAYKKPGFEEASVLVMLHYLDWRRAADRTFLPYKAPKGLIGLTQDPYLAGLNKLAAEYKTKDICAEVYLAKANYAIRKGQQPSALQICQEAIRLYPGYKRINALKNLKQEILSPGLSINAKQSVYPGKDMTLTVNHKNLNGFTARLYQGKKRLTEQHFSLIRPADYQMTDTTFVLKAPEVGEYRMQIVPDEKMEKEVEAHLYVTRFNVLTRSLPENNYEMVVLDWMSGQPIADATVTLYSDDDEELKQLTTNASGKALLPWNRKYQQLKVKKGQDTAMKPQAIFKGYYYYATDTNVVDRVELLTDRLLYRPGQTLYVKGIAYAQQLDTANVIANRNYILTLLDANQQEVGRKELRTNEFGSFTTDFTLPAACLNGVFTLQTIGGSTTNTALRGSTAYEAQGSIRIRVEDYKRPTFDITFDKPKGSYSLGDKIEVKGKVQTFSGMPLQELPVQYTINCYQRFGWRGMRTEVNAQVSGTVTLNADGQFSIPVLLDGEEDAEMASYIFEIEATVTSVAGETETSLFNIAAGPRSLLLGTSLGERICKDNSIDGVVKATNLDGQPVVVEGTAKLYPMIDEESEKTSPTAAYTGTFTSNKEMALEGWKALPSGAYQLVLSAKDDQGREVTFKTRLVLFSTSDTRPAVKSLLWYYESNISFDAQHPAIFYFGTSERDAYVMMDLFCGNQVLESKALSLSDSIVRFDYPYKEAYGNGLTISFSFVRDGQLYQQNVNLRKRLPSKVLAMKWDVFRDKLRPGQQEEWKLTIQTPQGVPAMAEMLATMYDVSLDKIGKQNQSLMLYYNLLLPSVYWMEGSISNHSFYCRFPSKDLKVQEMVYDRFVQGPSFSFDGLRPTVAGSVSREKQLMVRGVSPMLQSNAAAVQDMAVMGKMEAGSDSEVLEEESEAVLPKASSELRTNLAETAFFYPQLRTNEQGEVSFSFTMPQSLTRWNFRGYSHTKGMLTGMIDAEATTSKEFMLTPNLPRFVRVGDKSSVAASIANLTEKNLSGIASFILFDPMTEKVISTQKQKFVVEAGRTTAVSYQFTASSKYGVLGCRMIADGGTFSDGEQQLIPVLSNQENLTETVPMAIRGKETRVFSLDSLFNGHSPSATDRRLTVEFTSNPAWYAVQALPVLGQPNSESALSWAAMYYANTLASYIMNSQPRIKALFDSWKLQGGTKETLLSNLQKNPEVKNIILAESPWVMEALTEQQQQERIATLFDLNNIRNSNTTALTKLKALQLSNGSWSWYKGMTGNQAITGFIAQTNARLSLLTGQPLEGEALSMQQSALGYLNKKALEEYLLLHKAEKEGSKITTLSDAVQQYLYLMAISSEKVPAANEAAYRYFLDKLSATQPVTMGDKALAAITLQKAGRVQKAQQLMASLKEHLLQTPEQGMYFAFYETPYNWYGMQIPAHVSVMEAFEVVTKDRTVVEEMKLWLLKQKQTQQWDSPVSTVDAIYALLNRGISLLNNQGDVRITLAGEVMETLAPSSTTIPGLGYIQKTFTDQKVVNASRITVAKQDSGIAWGAVYGQYLEDISQVKQQGGPLNVEKKLYVERLVGSVSQLQPVTSGSVLSVGDKVVSRLTIRLDRPMEFVQLKEQRAACFEPIGNLSGYCWNNGLGYYVDVKDASTSFFFDGLGKGVFVLEYSYRVSRSGTYESGLATIQSAYAPEFVSHSASMKVQVKQD